MTLRYTEYPKALYMLIARVLDTLTNRSTKNALYTCSDT